MADQWYYSQEGQHKGPLSDEQLKQLASSGQIRPTDVVWKSGMQQWVAASSIKGLFPESPPRFFVDDNFSQKKGNMKQSIRKAQEQVEQASKKVWFLDLTFTHFVTPKLLSTIWVIGLILWILTFAANVVYNLLHYPALMALVYTVGELLVVLFAVVWMRVCLELFAVIFRIAENLEPLKYLGNPQDLEHHEG